MTRWPRPVWSGVRSADDDPVAVIQGYGFELTWQQLNEAAIAIHRGAHWVATNTDPTRPTDRGLVPGQRRRGGGGRHGRAGRARGGRQAVPAPAGRHRGPARCATGRSSSATGWTPTSPARWTRVWTACWCCPGPTERATCCRPAPAERPTHLGSTSGPCSTRRCPSDSATAASCAGRPAPGPRAPTCWSAGRPRTGSGRLGRRARSLVGRRPRGPGRPGDQASCTALISSTAAQTRYASTAGHRARRPNRARSSTYAAAPGNVATA